MPAGFFLKPYDDAVIYTAQNKADFFFGGCRERQAAEKEGAEGRRMPGDWSLLGIARGCVRSPATQIAASSHSDGSRGA